MPYLEAPHPSGVANLSSSRSALVEEERISKLRINRRAVRMTVLDWTKNMRCPESYWDVYLIDWPLRITESGISSTGVSIIRS